MRYVTGGESGPLVVFECGGGDAADMWVAVQELVSRTTRTLAYDRAGLGGSDPSRAPRTLENLTSDALQLLDALGIDEPAVFVGHSWGGNIIRLLAARAPERVRALMYVDPTLSAVFDGSSLRPVRIMHWWWHLQVLLGGRSRLLRRFRDGRWPKYTERQFGIALQDHWTSAGLKTTRRELKHIRESRPLIMQLEARPDPMPVRYLIGLRGDQQVRSVMLNAATRLAALAPNGSCVGIEDTGHSIGQERPRRTADEVQQFVAEVTVR
jgi:pimeloyl-ACP methyl ester carboxylesterase